MQTLKLKLLHEIKSKALFLVFVSLIPFVLLSSNNVFAADQHFTVSVDTALEVNIPSNVNLNIVPTDAGTYATTDLNIVVGTNNKTGYTMNMELPDTNLTNNITIPDPEQAGQTITPTIPFVTESTTEDNFTLNHWGISLDNGNTFNPIASFPSPLRQTEEPINSDTTTLTLATKVDLDKPNGTYTTTINFIVIANPVDQPVFNGIKTMQEMTGDICDAETTPLPTATESTAIHLDDNTLVPSIQLKDTRDNKLYWVSKLADGNCWMTQNLDLDLDKNVALTNQDTDLNSVASWTPASSTIIATSASVPSWAANNVSPYSCSADLGNPYLANGTTSTNIQPSDEEGGLHRHRGNYYNWTAAIASNNSNVAELKVKYNNAPDSICAKGWRLPTARDADAQNDFYNLFETVYGIPSSSVAGQTLPLMAPLFFNRSGLILTNESSQSSLGYNGAYGYYWSSTVYDAGNAYNLSTSSTLSTKRTLYKNRGTPIRCLARSNRTYNLSFNANSGTGAPETMTATVEADSYTFILPSAIPTYDGRVFLGWDTNPDATMPAYLYSLVSGTFSPTTITIDKAHKDTTLYAIYGDIETVVPNFTFSNSIHTLTMGGFNVYRTSSNLSLTGSYDLTKMAFMEFDFYVPIGGDVSQFNGMDTQLELSSSGREDVDEINWRSFDYFTNSTITPGEWSHIVVPFAEISERRGAIDMSRVNFIGLYWNYNTNDSTDYTISSCQIKNFKFSNYAKN